MAIFIFTGKPTYGMTTKDVKIPNGDGFTIYEAITPNVTPINTTNTVEIAYMVDRAQIFTQKN